MNEKPYPLSASEAHFWQIVWDNNAFQIARRFYLPEAAVIEKLAAWQNIGRKRRKFERWAAIQQPSVGKFRPTNYVARNDFDFSHRLKLAMAIQRIRNNVSNFI